jgi:hypothetical protein
MPVWSDVMPTIEARESSASRIDPAALALLEGKLAAISGVRVFKYASQPLGDPVYEVELESCGRETEMAVYRAKLEVYQAYPDARIELNVV